MIRDPSDGSVKEISPEANEINAIAPKQVPKGIGPDTGIRQPTRTDAQERLERSREWLRNYQERQHAARGSDIEQKHPTDGRAGNDQGAAEPTVPIGDRSNAGAPRQG